MEKYTENRRGGEPQRIGDILAELLAHYDRRFPAARATVIATPPVMEDNTCSYYPAELVSVS
jgi:hypothetical protein